MAIAFMRAAWSAGSKREGRGLKNQVDFFLQNNVEQTNHSNMGHDKESERCIVPVLHRIFALGNLRRALDKI